MADDERTATGGTSAGADDAVLPFQTERSRVTGRLVRLGSVADGILSRHDYPEPISEVLGQALALTALLGTALKFDGRLILQTKTDGALNLLVSHYESPGRLRGYAGRDKARFESLQAVKGRRDHGEMLGTGYLAMTIDPGGTMERYQGIVALQQEPLVEAALNYFRQSEQIPTFLRLAVARHYSSAGPNAGWHWRAGGLLLQYLTAEGGKPRSEAQDDADEQRLEGDDDESWQRARLLAQTVEDHELLDPTLAPERLLYRLFHEEGVRMGAPRPVEDRCGCSRERIVGFLSSFGEKELDDMHEPDGSVTVTCEFCGERYWFAPGTTFGTDQHTVD